MPVYRLKSDILGIDFGVESQQELTERDYFDILKTKVSPQKMLRAYKNNKDDEKVQALATKALDNNYFEGADFGTGFSEGAKSFGRGVKKMFVTNIYGTSRLLDATMQYGEADESQRYDELVEEGIKKAGQQLKGLSYASKRTDRTIEDDLSQALQFAGLSEDDENLKKRVIAEARRQDNSQAEATRAQMGVDAVGMMSMLGAKLFQGLGDAKDIATGKVSFGGDSKKRKLRQLDYLIEQDYIGRTIERGAELGLQLGGAISTISQIYTGMDLSPFEKNEEALRDVKSGLVKPDRDVAMLGSMFADPGMGATVLASGGLAFGRNFIARGAIIKTGQKAAQESALKSTIAQLSDIANPTNTQKALLKTAEKNLAKVTGSGEKLEKLVAKAEGIAQAEAGKLLQKGQGNTPMAARLFQAIDKAPPPKAPFSNRMTGKILEKAGISAEYLGRTIEFLQRLPEETLGTLFMRSGMDEQAAMTASRATARTLQGTAAAGVVTGGFNEFSPELENLGLALLLAPGGSSLVTRFGHDAAILGKQLQYAQTSSPLFQRIAQLDPADSSLTAVTLDRTSALTIPGTISGLAEGIFAKSRQFGPSPALKAPATALTRTGLGNTLTGAVNATKTAVGASAIPGAIGYAVDGEAGAGGAIAASIPFIAAGLGFGTLARYGSQADVRAKMLGDQAYYKDTYLTDTEVGMYDSLAKPVRQAIATSVIQNPDVVYRFQNDRGNSHWSVENGESVVTIFTKSAPQEQLSAVLGHEIAHHIDAFGFMPQILEQLVGSVEKNQPGLFTEYKNGKPIIIKDAEGRDVYATNKEFAKHRQRYLDRLEQSGVDKNSPDYQAYANNDARIAREIFASHGAAWYFGGDFVTRNYQGAGAKMMGAILDPLFSSPGLRKFFHRIGLATEETTGLVADPLRLFPELKEIPALTRMIEKYNDDVRGFGPQARREGRGRGNLVDPEFADEIATASLTAKDLENPAIVNRLKAGGVVKIKDDGSIETDASGKPVFLPSREVNKKNKQLSQDILQIIRKKEDAGETFGEGHVSLEKTADGKERASGRFIDPSIIDELAKTGKYNPHQLAALKQISQTLRNNTGDVWNLFYYSALKWNKAGRKVYGQIKGGDRKSLPFGIEITKDGNINIQTISVDAFKKNLEWFAKSKGYEKKMSEAFGGMNAWENAQNAYKLLPTYLQNHMKGIINGTPESGITPLQRDLINAAIGRVNADQVKANPILEGLGDRRSQRQQSIRSRRLDRIGNAIRGESGFPAFKSAIEQNKVPMYMPAAYHGTPHTFAPEPGAPFGKFRTSAIGTGEGAQAYGHGLYFAGNKEVAAFYREQLAPAITKNFKLGTMDIFKNEVPFDYSSNRLRRVYGDESIPRASLIEALMIDEGTIRRAFLTDGEEGAKKAVKEVIEDFIDTYDGEADYINVGKKALKMPIKFEVSEPGSLYKVELAPKENEYLLWDKPLSEQPKGVREKLAKARKIEKRVLGAGVNKKEAILNVDDRFTKGGDAYKELATALSRERGQQDIRKAGGSAMGEQDALASQFLKEAGIPGIKYLDGSSRSKGEGDYNYVIFDEADVQITDKLFMPMSKEETIFAEVMSDSKFKSDTKRRAEMIRRGVPQDRDLLELGQEVRKKLGISPYESIKDAYKAQSPDKLFMPASEAGAGKGKVAEAAKLWQEKGTDSPYFKKWFGKSKVVDKNGEPLVVYRGQTQWSKDGTMDYKEQRAAPSFTSVPEVANMYTHVQTGDFFTTKVKPKGAVSPVYLKMDNPLKIETLENISSTRGSVLEILDASSFNWDFYGDVKTDKSLWTIDDTIDLFSNLSDPADPILVEVERGWGMPNIADDAFEIAEYLSNKLEKHQEKLRKLDKDSSEYMRLEDDFTEDINYFLDNVKIDTYAFADTHIARDYAERNGFDGFIHEDVAEGISPYASMDTVAGKPIEEVKGIKTTDEDGERLKKEDYSFTVYKPFSPEQIKSATGNRGTFDAGERNINYMPSDPKAPKRQPANRITRQAPAMPGNRFMLPAVSAGAKSAERFR